jgi:hypothetical protein
LDDIAFPMGAASVSRSDDYESPFGRHRIPEVDLVIERDDGAVVGIEVKAAGTVTERDFTGRRRLASACGERFTLGVALYDSDAALPFGPRLHAAPLSCLWL